jgi:hypothetical protein
VPENLDDLAVLDPIHRGDDRTIKVTATYPEAIPEQDIEAGDPYPLDGVPLYFTAKYKTTDEDVDAVFQKTSTAGAIVARAAPDNHICDIEIAAEDTEGMEKGKDLICDVQVMGTQTWTIWKGILPIFDDVTRAT